MRVILIESIVFGVCSALFWVVCIAVKLYQINKQDPRRKSGRKDK